MAASARQINYIKLLRGERDLPAPVLDRINARLAAGDIEFGEARETIIPFLLTFPVKAGAVQSSRAAFPKVADGRYAVREEGELRFFKVRTPDAGDWAGFTFVDRQSAADMWPIKDKGRKRRILEAIASDPEAATRAYGLQLGVCGICGIELTNEDSRRNGIGPVCAEKHGLGFSRGIDTDLDVLAPEATEAAAAAPAARTPERIQADTRQALDRLNQREPTPERTPNVPSSYDAIMKLRQEVKR